MVDKGKKKEGGEKKLSKSVVEANPTLQIVSERDIALDFATKVYSNFDQMVKSIILFGSSAKKVSLPDSDIDVVIIIDDVAIAWDETLIAHYRESLGNLVKENPYRKSLHINTVKLSTWWADLLRGDPVVINVLRYGDALIDRGGFFEPLKVLLKEGKIKSTPESIYTLLQRSPTHLFRAREAMLAAVDGFYWSAVDAAHAALIADNVMPPSPEHIPEIMDEHFVKKKLLHKKYVNYYYGLHNLSKEIAHGRLRHISGKELERLQDESDKFLGEMAKLVDKLIDRKY
jgi:predicted nucleotidyltransferase/uncharacterized protein (UPF0332 family)